MLKNQALNFQYDETVVDQIAARCKDIESGARNIDHIVNKSLLPLISTYILSNIGNETEFANLKLHINDKLEFEVSVS